MRGALLRLTLFALATIVFASSSAFGQGGSAKSSLSGTVTDANGGVLPGAAVVVKNMRTGVESTTVTNSTGAFDVPVIDAGLYTVTVSLDGFKTVVMTDIELITATVRALKITLELGAVTETVEVRGGAQLVQTQSTTVSSTIRADQIQNLPLVTRNGLNFVVFLPGVDTGGGHSQRDSTLMGLPESTISISIDGANIQDAYTKSTDGFFAEIRPQLDMIEEVTVSMATAGADSAAQGAVQIKFVTRSGTNKFIGSAYENLRHHDLNTNSYFNIKNNLPKNKLVLNQFGAREGGPIMIPGLFDGRNKAFFFFNYEQFRFPSSATRTRNILSPLAQQGIFQYSTAGGIQRVNLFALAAANGHTATIDPTIGTLLSRIRAATATTGTVNDRSDPNLQDFVYQPDALRLEHLPNGRIDINLTSRHRLSSSYNFQKTNSEPDLFNNQEARFPGFGTIGKLGTFRNLSSTSLRSTFGAKIVNELRFGFRTSPIRFNDIAASEFDDQGGFSIGFPQLAGINLTGINLTGATTLRNNSSRNGRSWNLDNTVNWIRGAHSLQFGESFSRISGWSAAQNIVPTITLGVDTTNDPANAMFTTGNFTGAANADLTNARALYALLTGRVTAIGSEVRLDPATGRYVYMGGSRTEEQQDEIGLFIQDSWRLRQNLTINAGLRWQVALPFRANVNVYSMNTFADLCGVSGTGDGPGGRGCNLFNPGVFNAGGRVPVYEPYNAGSPGYETDLNNFAPNVGVAWQPNVQSGWLRQILGDPALATVRASYGVAYNSNGLSFYTGIYNANPGNIVSTTRNATSAQFPLVPAGQTWPVLLRETSRLGAPPNIPTAPAYPAAINYTSGVNMFDPNFQTPFTRSFSVGLQRAISKQMVVEVRYIGTRLVDGTSNENWNQRNFTSNGFLDEFKLAQQNLQVAIAQGCGQTGRPACSFAYQGPGTGTFPLPIYLATFTGTPRAQAGDVARYTGTNWTNTTRIGELAIRNPNPGNAVNALVNDAAFRANIVTAGLPRNFFVLNPDVDNANIMTNGNFTKYDSIQINLRRQLSNGFTADVSYVAAKRLTSALDDLRRDRVLTRSTDGVPHALKLTANYDLPFGRNGRFGANMSRWLDAAVGGWSLNLTGRVQSGTIFNFNNVRVVGMSIDELRNEFKIRIDPVTKIIYSLPQDIIDNTIKAFSISATSPTGYSALGAPSGRYLAPANGPDCIQEVRGDCAPRDVFVEGPIFTRFDLATKKRFNLGGNRSFDFEADILNLFNAINFNAVAQTGSGATLNQVTSSYQDASITFDPGGRLMQLVFRLNF